MTQVGNKYILSKLQATSLPLTRTRLLLQVTIIYLTLAGYGRLTTALSFPEWPPIPVLTQRYIIDRRELILPTWHCRSLIIYLVPTQVHNIIYRYIDLYQKLIRYKIPLLTSLIAPFLLFLAFSNFILCFTRGFLCSRFRFGFSP